MMLLVIYGHITATHSIINYVYSFHMPIFFIMSGMLFRFNKETSSLSFVKKKVLGLMLPYLALSLYVAPLREWLEQVGECNSQSLSHLLMGTLISNADSGLKMSSNTTWFIPCLFLTTVLFFFLRKAGFRMSHILSRWISRKLPQSMGPGTHKVSSIRLFARKVRLSDLLITLLFLAVLGGSVALDLTHGSGGLWHWRVSIVACGFYLIGYLFMPLTPKIHDVLRKAPVLGLAAVPALFALGYVLSHENGYVSMIHNQYHDLVIYYVAATATSLAWVLIFMMTSHYNQHILLLLRKVFTFVGLRTLPYIAFQVPVMKLIRHYVDFFQQEGEVYAALLTLLVYFGLMPLAFFVNKIIPKRLSIPRTWPRGLGHLPKGVRKGLETMSARTSNTSNVA